MHNASPLPPFTAAAPARPAALPDRASAAECTELEELRVKYAALKKHSANQRHQLRVLQDKRREENAARTAAAAAARPRPVTAGGGTPRPLDRAAVLRRVPEMCAPQRRKTDAERLSDQLAAESMRGYKPSTWRRGKSRSRYC